MELELRFGKIALTIPVAVWQSRTCGKSVGRLRKSST
jgi:hypothetical protein